jgi:hypothetical protein
MIYGASLPGSRFYHRQSSGAGIGNGVAGNRRWSNGLLSCYRASTDLLSCVPANVYGYAALVGYTLSAASWMRLRPRTTQIRYSSS